MRGHTPAPVTASERIRWPETFGTRFVIFVDTEEEFDWSAPLSRDNRSVTAVAALPDAHRRFADRGVPVTYLVDHPVASDPSAAAVLRELVADGAEIGAQLHPWVNPPFDDVPDASSFAGNLPPAVEAAKLDRLTDTIVAAVGRRPRVYRAGRYGIGAATLRLLASRGYRLDSSMRAGYAYGAEGGPDFTAIDSHAFRRDAMIELPLTTSFVGMLGPWARPAYRAATRVPWGRGILARTGLTHRIALTPEDMPLPAAQAAVRAALNEGVRILHFSFHSPSLVPGHTPYVRDAADLARFAAWWDAMLDMLAACGVRPASLDDILTAAGELAPVADDPLGDRAGRGL